MTLRLLSQMEDTRLKKEKVLTNYAFTTPVIVAGSILVVIGILLLAFTGLVILGEEESAPPVTEGSQDYTVCAGIFMVFVLIGFTLLLVGIVRTVKSSEEAGTSEDDYQQTRSQVMAMLAERESR